MSVEPQMNVKSPPLWEGDGALFPVDFPMPGYEFGSPIKWKDEYSPPPIFVGQAKLAERDIYLFGLRYELNQRVDVSPGTPEPTGFFVNYVAIEAAGGRQVAVHVLAQWKSSTHQAGQERADTASAGSIKKKDRKALCLGNEPKWKDASARWPTLNGAPMKFVEQFALFENDVTRRWLTFDTGVFLFWCEVEGASVFKITTQDIKFQSAEDHYRGEAVRMAKAQRS